MFLDAGAEELVMIAAVALIVVGPKDLPPLLRKVGQWTAKMRGLAAEFRSSFDELARQSELDELRKEVEALRTGQYVAPISHEIDTHFDALHAQFGAPPPPLLTDEGIIQPGPDAPPEVHHMLALQAPAEFAAPYIEPTTSTELSPALAQMRAPSIFPSKSEPFA